MIDSVRNEQNPVTEKKRTGDESIYDHHTGILLIRITEPTLPWDPRQVQSFDDLCVPLSASPTTSISIRQTGFPPPLLPALETRIFMLFLP